MKHYLSKSLSINSDVFFKVDKTSNRLVLVSHFGKFHFYLFNASCFLVKEGQKLTFLLECMGKGQINVHICAGASSMIRRFSCGIDP